MKKRKTCLSLLMGASILLITSSSLVSCKNNTDELVIWAWNKNVAALNEGIKLYQQNINPKFKARVESFARNDIDKKFKTASQTGDKNSIGDIVLCDAMNILTYYDLWSDIFVNLKDDVKLEDKSRLVQSTLDSISLDDKLIGLPFGIGPTVVFANKNLWAEESLNKVKSEGWTWDEYQAIGLEIKKAKGDDVCMTSYNLRNDDRLYRTLVSQKGEWFMDKEYNVFVGNDNSVNAMNIVKTMKENGTLGHIDTGDYKSLMKNNKIAAQIQGFFLGGQLKDVAPEMSGDWEILPLPKWNENDDTSASITGGSYLYANSRLKGENRDNAVDFIKWMTLENESVVNTLKVAGIYPALKSSYDTEYFKETKDPYFSNASVIRNVGIFSSEAKPIIGTKYNGFNYDEFVKVQEKILFTTNYESVNEELVNLAKVMKDNAK